MHTPLWTRGRLTAIRTFLVLALALCTSVGVVSAAPRALGFGGANPVIDGNGDDLISFAAGVGATSCAVDRTDNRDDIVIADPKIIVCATQEDTDGDNVDDYFVNGFDVRRFVLVYDRPNKNLYVLFRMEGFVGDVDGNSNPDNNQCPPTVPSFGDQVGIGTQENYQVRIDTNCDGLPDVEIKVGGVGTDQISVTGATTGATSLAYRAGAGTGKDLEVLVSNIDLPPVFRISANANASFDGLGEDITPTATCGDPAPSIDLTKSVNVPVICPGGSADFTMVVTNTGNVDLAGVTLVDNLPAGLTYTSTVSNTCGGAVNAVGNQITYGPFNLAIGASCTIVLRVGRTADCAGQQTNNASVEGSFTSPCFNQGQPIIVSDNASASILCGNVVCSIDAPDTRVCPGETVQICGPAGDFSYLWNTGATTRCITVGAGPYSLTVTDNVSGCVSTNPCEVTIVEDPRPVCSISADKDAVCGDETARLCGPEGPYTYLWNTGATTRCIDVGAGTYSLVITNTQTGCVSNNTCEKTIIPRSLPCVEVAITPIDALCVGEAFELCGTVKNCGTAVADLEVDYNGVKRNFTAVPAGETREWCIPAVMPACSNGIATFNVTGKATNDCGPITQPASESINCKVPQIDVEKVARETSVANLGTIHYSITVRNPSSTVALSNVVVVDDLCAYAKWTGVANPAPSIAPNVGSAGGTVTWNVGNLAPLAEVVITFEVTADIAAGGGVCPTTVQCQNDVYATGLCAGGGEGQTPVRDDDSITTPITCAGEACPRTVGFWGVQCAQKGNGSTKFTRGPDDADRRVHRRAVVVLQLVGGHGLRHVLPDAQHVEHDGARPGQAPVRRRPGERLHRRAEPAAVAGWQDLPRSVHRRSAATGLESRHHRRAHRRGGRDPGRARRHEPERPGGEAPLRPAHLLPRRHQQRREHLGARGLRARRDEHVDG